MATDAQVRQKLKDLIKAVHPTAQVYGWNALSHELGDWPGMFRTTDFASSGKTHGWIVKRAGSESRWKRLGADRVAWIYDLWGFYGFRSGKEGDNSDDEFAGVCQAVYDAIKATPKLDIECVDEHELLQFDMITTIDCGEETLHFAKGKLKLRLCC